MKKHFITGLVILLPLAVTIAVVVFLVNFFTKPFVGFVSEHIKNLPGLTNGFLFLTQDQMIRYGSRILILIVLFFVTIGLGFVARWFLLNSLIHFTDSVLTRIPLVSTVYKTSQDIIKTLFVSDKKSFKQVVMVPFPRPGVFMIGLIARESPPMCSNAAQKSLISVLVPTTPNPTTGFLMMFEEKDIIYLDMKPEDAIKYIVSCGVIIPEPAHMPNGDLRT